jgi:sugar lactone lactonase YvrE
MFKGLRTLPMWQRRLIFIAIFGGGIFFLIACTLFLITQTILIPRADGQALVPEVGVAQFAALPDDNAYPATVAAAPDGVLYTGSYATGALWRITRDGSITELPDSREQIGAVSGLTVDTTGTLWVVDVLDTDPRSTGGALWRVTPDGQIMSFGTLGGDVRGFIAPDDIAVDAAGNVYVSDRGRNEILRFTPDGAGSGWWRPAGDGAATQRAITGLAYDPARDALLVADPEVNEIYRVSVSDGATEILYSHGNREFPPGFDGITVAPDGSIYIAALGQNGVARVGDGELDFIAGLFRGASDVEWSNGRLYVTNFDQASLVLPLLRPSLPFAIDAITFAPLGAATPAS